MPNLPSIGFRVSFSFVSDLSIGVRIKHGSTVLPFWHSRVKFSPLKIFGSKPATGESGNHPTREKGFVRPNSNKVQQKDSAISGIFLADKGQLYDGFNISTEDVVVDVGCGDGSISLFAARQKAKVIATDVCPHNVEATRKRLAKSAAREFEVHQSTSTPLPLADHTATKVICREVLEHVDDPAAVMKELVRVGAPGATFLITVPDPVGEKIQKKIAPAGYWEKPNHVRIFERDEFAELLEHAGLQVEQRQSHGFYWSMWWVLFWAADQELGEPNKPILDHWAAVWSELMQTPKGEQIKEVLDDFMPKSQVLIARKAA